MQGIQKSFDYKKILKALKKDYCCNGTVVEDKELGQVIQVQGDQRKNIADFLTQVCSTCVHMQQCIAEPENSRIIFGAAEQDCEKGSHQGSRILAGSLHPDWVHACSFLCELAHLHVLA